MIGSYRVPTHRRGALRNFHSLFLNRNLGQMLPNGSARHKWVNLYTYKTLITLIVCLFVCLRPCVRILDTEWLL